MLGRFLFAINELFITFILLLKDTATAAKLMWRKCLWICGQVIELEIKNFLPIYD